MQLLTREAEVQQIAVINASRDEYQNVIRKVMQRGGGGAGPSHRRML